MADLDTSFYPKSQPINLLSIASDAQSLRNSQQQNQLLQTENQRSQVGLSQAHIDLAHSQYDGLGKIITAAAADPNLSPDMVHSLTDNAVKLGYVTPDVANAALETMPQDPSKLRQWVQNMGVRLTDAQSSFSSNYGTPSTINNNNRIIPVTASPITGVRRIGADIPMETSPAERGVFQTGTNAQGQSVLIPQAQASRAAGLNPLTNMPIDPGNRLVTPGTPQHPAATMQPQLGGGVAVSPPAGEVDAQKNMATASAGKYSADQDAEANYQNDVLPMTKALGALQKLGPTGTGPGSQTWNDLRSFFITQGVMNTDDKTPVYDVAKKYLTQLGRQSGDTGTNDKLAAAFAGSPSTNISNAGAQEVLKTMISMRKLQNARVQAFASSGLPASQYQKWAVNFGKTQDPVAYGADLMAPDEIRSYFGRLSQADQNKFLSSYRQAKQFGLVSAPATGGANGG